jgi:CheY-like chemotaxis protein
MRSGDRVRCSDALEKLSTNPRIEILITDINMPGMDGYALAQTTTQMRDLKVIMLSGREHDGRSYESRSCGTISKGQWLDTPVFVKRMAFMCRPR